MLLRVLSHTAAHWIGDGAALADPVGWATAHRPFAADPAVCETALGLPLGIVRSLPVLNRALGLPETATAAHAAAMPASRLQAALVEADIEAALRWRQATGYAVDSAEINRRIADRDARRAADRRRLNIDPAASDPAAQKEVARRGIVTRTNPGDPAVDGRGLPKLGGEYRRNASVPPEQREWWEQYGAARASAMAAGELRKLAGKVVAGRIYPRFNVMGAVTTRMTTTTPNVMGMPRGDRDVVLADPGGAVIAADWSQCEVRIAGWLSGDAALAADAERGDVYTQLAERIGAPRGIAKVAVLASLYGQGAVSLAANLGVTVDRAREVRTQIAAAWPALDSWLRGTAEARGPITLWDGTLLPAPPERYQRANWTVQGTAARLFKPALLRAAAAAQSCGGSLFIPVHDEISVTVPATADLDAAAAALEAAMAFDLGSVRLRASATVLGDRWGNPK